MNEMKRGCFLVTTLFLLLSCVPWLVTADSENGEDQDIPGTALPPLKLGNSICALKADDGPCKAILTRYYFNIQTRHCEMFEYGGCDGNQNNFMTLEECQEMCVVSEYPVKKIWGKFKKVEKPDFCFLEEDPGICRGYISRYFYNKESQQCEKFKYGGCLGNQNNFKTLEECQVTCKDNSNSLQFDHHEKHPIIMNNSSPAEKPSDTPSLLANSLQFDHHEEHPNMRNNSAPAEKPSDTSSLLELPLYIDEGNKFSQAGWLSELHKFQETGWHPGDCDDPEKQNLELPPIPSLCKTPADRGLCKANEKRFFYDYSAGKCRLFRYSGCGGNENNFISRKSCLRACKKGFNKNQGQRRLMKLKRKRKKQPVKLVEDKIITEKI